MTPVEHCASAASAALARTRPSAAISSARLRAGVMRGGVGRAFVEADAEAGPHRLEYGRGAHHHAHHHAEGGQRVARHPFGEAERDGGQRRHVAERLGNRLELLVGDRLAALAHRAIPDHADAALRPERDEHEGARGGLHVRGEHVVIGLVQRDGHQHGHAPLVGGGPRRGVIELGEQALQAAVPCWGPESAHDLHGALYSGT